MIVIIVNNLNLKCQQVRVCHVCGEKAGKHSYYGGQVINAIIMIIKIIGITIIMIIGVTIIMIINHDQVCPSCRAFFRRSVQSGYNATYFCVKDGSCQVF